MQQFIFQAEKNLYVHVKKNQKDVIFAPSPASWSRKDLLRNSYLFLTCRSLFRAQESWKAPIPSGFTNPARTILIFTPASPDMQISQADATTLVSVSISQSQSSRILWFFSWWHFNRTTQAVDAHHHNKTEFMDCQSFLSKWYPGTHLMSNLFILACSLKLKKPPNLMAEGKKIQAWSKRTCFEMRNRCAALVLYSF